MSLMSPTSRPGSHISAGLKLFSGILKRLNKNMDWFRQYASINHLLTYCWLFSNFEWVLWERQHRFCFSVFWSFWGRNGTLQKCKTAKIKRWFLRISEITEVFYKSQSNSKNYFNILPKCISNCQDRQLFQDCVYLRWYRSVKFSCWYEYVIQHYALVRMIKNLNFSTIP